MVFSPPPAPPLSGDRNAAPSVQVNLMVLAAQSVDFVFVRRDSAIFKQAWMALAAPSVAIRRLE